MCCGTDRHLVVLGGLVVEFPREGEHGDGGSGTGADGAHCEHQARVGALQRKQRPFDWTNMHVV